MSSWLRGVGSTLLRGSCRETGGAHAPGTGRDPPPPPAFRVPRRVTSSDRNCLSSGCTCCSRSPAVTGFHLHVARGPQTPSAKRGPRQAGVRPCECSPQPAESLHGGPGLAGGRGCPLAFPCKGTRVTELSLQRVCGVRQGPACPSCHPPSLPQ